MTEEKTFIATGTYKEKELKIFTKEVKAQNESYAREKVLSGIGSKHKVNRNLITIEKIEEKKEE